MTSPKELLNPIKIGSPVTEDATDCAMSKVS